MNRIASELRRFASLALQWADVLDAETASLQERTPEPSAAAPVFFSCSLCGRQREWRVAGYAKPWPGAMCRDCYAEMRMHRDEIQDQAVGYTGQR